MTLATPSSVVVFTDKSRAVKEREHPAVLNQNEGVEDPVGCDCLTSPQPKKSRRRRTPEGAQLRRLTLQRATRRGRVALHQVIRKQLSDRSLSAKRLQPLEKYIRSAHK